MGQKLEELPRQPYSGMPKTGKKSSYPLSSVQRRLYYQWELDKTSVAYNIPVALKIEGKINVPNLENTLKKLIHRHEALRTYFEKDEDEEVSLKIAEDSLFKLDLIDSSVSNLELALQEMVTPFDLSTIPLFRMKLLKLNENLHLLFADFHHIISDGISLDLFCSELFAHYHGNELQSLSIQYTDYSQWEIEHLKTKVIRESEKFWLDHLEGDLPSLRLPTDFERPSVFKAKGRKIRSEISASQLVRLQNLCLRRQCTISNVLQAVYRLFLYKFCGQAELVLGIPVSGRIHPELAKVHGMFVNNLALRNQILPSESFVEFLDRESTLMMKALAHQDFPFEILLERIAPRRDVSRNPLFDTMFIYQEIEDYVRESKGLKVRPYFFDPGIAKYDLSVAFYMKHGEGMEFHLEYASTLFKERSANAIIEYFHQLLDQVLADPHKKLASYTLLSPKDYEDAVKTYNPPGTLNAPVDVLFERKALELPDQIALRTKGIEWTYSDLRVKVGKFAELLKTRNIGSGNTVALLMTRSPELLVAMLATIKVGACYLPIDTGQPTDRIAFMLEHSGTDLLIINRPNAHQSKRFFQDQVDAFLDLSTCDFSKNPVVFPDSQSTLDGAAYLIYTSGTSGRPKGVKISNGALSNYLLWGCNTYLGDESLAFPLFTSISFDLTVTSLFMPLISGNTLVIYESDNQAEVLPALISNEDLDIVKLTPSHLKLLLSNAEQFPKKGHIKKLIVGGEALETSLAVEITRVFGKKLEIYNEYGPTEATVGCMTYLFTPEVNTKTVPIGKPAAQTQIYLLDTDLNPVPHGVEGEIFIAGPCLALGYFKAPELNAKAFVDNPFISGEKMYRTGDIAKKLYTGDLEFIGRKDNQLKIQGYRIDPGEIEYHLRSAKGVKDCVVTSFVEKGKDRLLVAFYVLKNVDEYSEFQTEIRDYLADRLPYYMIPAFFQSMSKIPLTTNGKVDYGALSINNSNVDNRPTIAPGKKEQLILGVWEDVLKGHGLTVRDNFYEIGGDSIKAVQIASRMKRLGMEVNAKDILTYHTIQQLSRHVSYDKVGKEREGNQKPRQGEIEKTPIINWFLTQNFVNPNFFNQSVLLRIRTSIDLKCLYKAFVAVIGHHDELRMNFSPEKQCLFYNPRLQPQQFDHFRI